jgi:uncharacterized protein YggE
MKSNSLRLLVIVPIAILVLGLIGIGAYWFGAPQVNAQTPTPGPGNVAVTALPQTITVVGEGTVTIKPDIARANIGVEVVSNTVQEASAENKATIEAVLEALMAQGIAEEDIQTSGFSIYAERYGPEGPLAEDEVRYRVSNNVQVTIRDLDNVGTILDAAVEAGANNIFGVDFDVDDPSVVESEARQKAVDDARAKAEELATLNGVTLGNVVSVSEVVGSGGGYYMGNFAEQTMMRMGGGGTPISPGELELTMQLQIVYSMSQ